MKSFDMAIFATIISGVLVFVLGQLFIRFVVEPLQDLKRVIGEISHALIYYADVYSNPGPIQPGSFHEEIVAEARKVLRDKASLLRSRASVVPFYDRFAQLHWVPMRADIKEASGHLIGLSNSLLTGGFWPWLCGNSYFRYPSLKKFFHKSPITNDLEVAKA